MATIRKILIANRGEIAVRIQRTCREMGIDTVAVFSDVDHDAPHVVGADEAVHIGPPAAADSYLRIDKLLEAAKRTGADAIHPGFGFLSERAEFAEACAEAGVIFIGPSPKAIRAMGLKKEAKEIAENADVPVVPGYNGADQAPATLAAEARKIGFPVLIKASAGGGGKGMRICRRSEDVEAAIEGAKREAQGAFGNDTLLIEKYIDNPRHVEFQILGDSHGNLVHLYERECSIQRRHQKVIEESPSPALDEELRSRMGRAAVAMGKAIGYENAGTVEFILGPDGSFYFLEVNTRLQVEHPVTECVTGVDLVREQVRVAQGEPLSFGQDDLQMQGAAVECRIYAEDPASQFLPASGMLVDWHVPDNVPGLRVDTGVRSGLDISIYYDPMLAKVITEGPTRREATQRMVRALSLLGANGIATNREFLIRTLQHPEYESGNLSTHFIDDHMSDALAAPQDDALELECGIAATLAGQASRSQEGPVPSVRTGFRLNYALDQKVQFTIGEREQALSYRDLGDGSFRFQAGEQSVVVKRISAQGDELTLETDGLRRNYRVVRDGQRCFVQVGGRAITLVEGERFPDLANEVPEGGCVAPMPGKVVTLDVEVGQKVEAGQRLLVMEAMKMEHTLEAPQAGTISEVRVEPGKQVDADEVLVVIADADD